MRARAMVLLALVLRQAVVLMYLRTVLPSIDKVMDGPHTVLRLRHLHMDQALLLDPERFLQTVCNWEELVILSHVVLLSQRDRVMCLPVGKYK
jgi:hypothetical protein